MLGFSVEVYLALGFVTSIALESTEEIIILALTANPTSIWEIEFILIIILLALR